MRGEVAGRKGCVEGRLVAGCPGVKELVAARDIGYCWAMIAMSAALNFDRSIREW